MITILNILIELCLIVAVWRLSKRRGKYHHVELTKVVPDKRLEGLVVQAQIESKVSAAIAERAFNLASAANLAAIALQKTLATPKLVNKAQVNRNLIAKAEIDKLFSTHGNMDLLRPILSEEEQEILDAIEEKNQIESRQQ